MSVIGGIDSADNLDQRGFPTTILACKTVDFSRFDFKVHLFERLYPNKRFIDVYGLEKALRHDVPPFKRILDKQSCTIIQHCPAVRSRKAGHEYNLLH